MRILFVGINYSPDFIGVAKYNAELCEALALSGHEVHVITAPPYYPAWKIPRNYRGWRYRLEKSNQVTIGRVPIYVPRVPSGIRRLVHHASFALASAISVWKIAFKWRPDVIFTIAPSLMSAPVVSFAAARIGAGSWLHVQDLEVDAAFDLGLLQSRWLRRLMIAIERKILGSFDRVSTISPQMRRRLQVKGINPASLREIRNWTDLSGIQANSSQTAIREALKFRDSDLVGLYAGTMSNKQGIELIIEAARALESSHPNVRFLLCGEGPHRERLKQMAVGLGNIEFIDFQPSDRFVQLLSMADFHLIPQKAAAADLVFPSKLGGIFASGRPVIVMANRDTGLAEEVEGAGLVIPPGEPHELYKAIVRLVEGAELRASLGREGKLRAKERWDKKAVVAALAAELAEFDRMGTSVPRWREACSI